MSRNKKVHNVVETDVLPAEEEKDMPADNEMKNADSEDVEDIKESGAPADMDTDTNVQSRAETKETNTSPDASSDEQNREEDTDKNEYLDGNIMNGLSSAAVQQRIAEGEVNTPVSNSDLTLKKIIIENVFTYFNLIFVLITIMLCLVRSFRDLTFLPVICCNTLIGIVQEWRAKKALDQMSIMTAPKTEVVRSGERQWIASAELVKDDVIFLAAGNQIPADGVVLSGSVQVNEALLTGESDEISKECGDNLMSGSYIVAGTCCARLEKVGEKSYVSQLTIEAKKQKKGEQSEMIRSLDRLVLIIGILIIPFAGILFVQQYHFNHLTLTESITGTAAAILGMIPEGLYLLASVAMAVSVARLAYNKVLVHNMKSIESLARADVLCVDKTGTITENTMAVEGIVPAVFSEISGYEEETDEVNDEQEDAQVIFDAEEMTRLELEIGDFAANMSGDNITMAAIRTFFKRKTGKHAKKVIPFSSVYKYSAAIYEDKQYVMGAPEFVLRDSFEGYRKCIRMYASKGYRVLVFGEYDGYLEEGELTETVKPLALVLLYNPVRKDVNETFAYFAKQGVEIKVISGDSPMTVSSVAKMAGVEHAERYIDASKLNDDELVRICEDYTVFGRVTPQQKRTLIGALKKNGHTVAMTGDGVNDVLALRDADCSIAMASGSDAACHAAQMVLLESDFARMPAVVTEGRRVVNNIERTASLFLVKNIFSFMMSLLSIIFMLSYPLKPSQISLISMFTIGIPAFFMSLETNKNPIRGHFLSNVFYRALPAGLTDFLVISGLVVFCGEFGIVGKDLSTSCTILLAIVGIMILYRIASPMTTFHWVLWISMILGILFCMGFLHNIFQISMISRRCGMLLLIFAVITEPLLRYLHVIIRLVWDATAKAKQLMLDYAAKAKRIDA